MATKARQQYFADEDSLQKIRREFSIADEIQQKIDSIEPWAQVNKIETVKVNWTALVPDANKAVNVEVPEVIDNLYTVDSDNALSAKQWKLLYDYIQNIASRWRFLSNWNSATGLPMTNPSESPYPYKSWDYFIVSNVATSWGTNYRPDGSSYIIWQASTVVETDSVDVSDFYFYDGTNWLLLKNSGRSWAVDSALSTTSTNPVENRVITNALNNKQDVLTAWNHIDITNNVISTTGLQEELTAWENITIQDVCHPNTQWPAPDWFHVPTDSEWGAVIWILRTTFWLPGNSTTPETYLKMPSAGDYDNYSGTLVNRNTTGNYRTVTSYGVWASACLFFDSSFLFPDGNRNRAMAASLRCFKNTPVTPDGARTTLYDWSSVAVNAWVFHNTTEWLISISWNWSTWYTIQDKNLWATAVYNSWDVLSDANCWYYYQWWNNYGFPGDTQITTSQTQVDASNYWPWNYYSSNILRYRRNDWSSVNNDNLWWWVTPSWTWCELAISATDTTYTAWTWISIDANNVISSTATSAQWWNITWTLSNQTDLQSALDSKVNLWMNKVFDSTVVEIWKWEHEPGGDSSGHHIELDPNWEVSTYNLTQAWHNEATLWSGTLELLNNTVLDWNKTATFDHEKIVADDWTDTETYNFFGNNRIARLSDVWTGYTAWAWINIDANNEISNTLPWPTIAATAPTGAEWALWYDTTNDVLMAHDWTSWKEAWTQMKVLSYGHSTWQDFLDAYNENAIVYCKASSQSNPWTWNQTRMAFMAFVDINATTWVIQGVEFQYYRSRNAHSTAATVLDEVYIYKLTSNWTWSVTQRDTAAKPLAWTWIWLTYNASGMTISADTTVLATQTDLNSKQDTLVSWTNIKTVNSNSLLGSWDLTLNDVKSSATAPSSPTEWMLWYDTTNDQLKVYDWTNWNVTGKEYNAGTWIEIWTIQDYSAMQWPAPDGFHVPLTTEWQAVKDIWTALGGWSSDWTNFWIALKLPFAGFRSYSSARVYSQDSYGYYWSSSRYDANYAYHLNFNSSDITPQSSGYSRACGFSVRCFKDTPTIPTLSWTKLYWTSIEAGWIFWSSTDWLISLSSDWTDWITIADKNLGATTVWNSGDTLSEANCWKYYQWGNNYGFPRTWSVTTSSTQVDASTYWPWNYYSSSTFITRSSSPYRWDTTDNWNLWWWETWVVTLDNVISNTGVLSVNGQTWNVTVDDNTKIFVVNESALTSWWSIFNVEPFKDICERLISNPKHIAYITNKTSIMPHELKYIGSVMQIISHSWQFLDENNWMFEFIYIWFPFVENRELFKYYWDIQVNSWTASVANITANKINFTPSNSWTTGQVLTKTSSWYNWQDASWWLQVAPNSPITWIKYVWYGTEADYNNLSQYYTDAPWDTEFRCF